MPDARAICEITDALRALAHRAQDAGSPPLRALITMTAEAAKREADKAERKRPTLGVVRTEPGASGPR